MLTDPIPNFDVNYTRFILRYLLPFRKINIVVEYLLSISAETLAYAYNNCTRVRARLGALTMSAHDVFGEKVGHTNDGELLKEESQLTLSSMRPRV